MLVMRYCSDANIARERNTISKIISQLYPTEEAIQTPFIFFQRKQKSSHYILSEQYRTRKPQMA